MPRLFSKLPFLIKCYMKQSKYAEKSPKLMNTARMINIIVLPIARYLVLVLNLPICHSAPPSRRLGSEPPL